MNKIKYCPVCNKYTMKEICDCGEPSITRKPPKYSPIDNIAEYRQEGRKEDLKARGLL